MMSASEASDVELVESKFRRYGAIPSEINPSSIPETYIHNETFTAMVITLEER